MGELMESHHQKNTRTNAAIGRVTISGLNHPLSTTLRTGESRDPRSVKIVSPIFRGFRGLSSVTSAMARFIALRRLRRFKGQVRTDLRALARWIDENVAYGSLHKCEPVADRELQPHNFVFGQ